MGLSPTGLDGGDGTEPHGVGRRRWDGLRLDRSGANAFREQERTTTRLNKLTIETEKAFELSLATEDQVARLAADFKVHQVPATFTQIKSCTNE